MTPTEFTTAAERIAGPYWRRDLGPVLGMARNTIYLYASGKMAVSERTQIQIADKLKLLEDEK